MTSDTRTECADGDPVVTIARSVRAPAASQFGFPTRIAALYELLSQLWASLVVHLNRALAAVGMSAGPAAGLAIVDALTSRDELAGYPLLPAVRDHLLAWLGRTEEAHADFELAAEIILKAQERTVFLGRAAAL